MPAPASKLLGESKGVHLVICVA